MKKILRYAFFVCFFLTQGAFAGFFGDLIKKISDFPRPVCSRRSPRRDARMSRRQRLIKDAATVAVGAVLVRGLAQYSSTYMGMADDASERLGIALAAGVTPLLKSWTKSFEVLLGVPSELRRVDRIDEIEEILAPLYERMLAHRNATSVIADLKELAGLVGQIFLLAAEQAFLQGNHESGTHYLQQFEQEVFNPSLTVNHVPDLAQFQALIEIFCPEQMPLYYQMLARAQQPQVSDAESEGSGDEDSDAVVETE